MAHYYYDMAATFDHSNDKYWTEEQVAAIPVYPATPELEEAAGEETSTLWPIHECTGPSYEPVDCANESEAREHLILSLNQSVYEYINDL
jgi:hypothetical protein